MRSKLLTDGVLGMSWRPPSHHWTTGSGEDPVTRHLKTLCWPALTHAPGACSFTSSGGTTMHRERDYRCVDEGGGSVGGMNGWVGVGVRACSIRCAYLMAKLSLHIKSLGSVAALYNIIPALLLFATGFPCTFLYFTYIWLNKIKKR